MLLSQKSIQSVDAHVYFFAQLTVIFLKSMIADQEEFCHLFHVTECTEWAQVEQCLMESPCENFDVLAIVSFTDENNVEIYQQKYKNQRLPDRLIMAERLITQDQFLANCITGAQNGNLTIYMRFQPIAKGKPRSNLLLDWFVSLRPDALVTLHVKICDLSHVHWDLPADTKSEEYRRQRVLRSCEMGRMKAFFDHPNTFLAAMEVVDWDNVSKLCKPGIVSLVSLDQWTVRRQHDLNIRNFIDTRIAKPRQNFFLEGTW